MPFILSDNFTTELSKLRQDYQRETGIDLNKAPQPYLINRFFGAKDIKARNQQICF